MTRIVIKKLIWDEFNVEHIKKHDVRVDEVESLAKNIALHKKAKQGRYSIIGRVGLRMLTAIVDRRELGIYYPVTARNSAKKERRNLYEKEKT